MSAKMIVYGVSIDGTLERCRARPENRGKRNCKHGDHKELSTQEFTREAIDRYNEEQLSLHYKAVESIKKNGFPKVSTNSIQTTSDGRVLSRDEFNEATVKLANSWPEEEWDAINEFSHKADHLISLTHAEKQSYAEASAAASENILKYLESDDPTAVKTREFLGKDIDLKDFCDILTHEVGAMRNPKRWNSKGKNESISRIVLTNVNNDMTKERYVASVLFFGGRCCYCNCAMNRKPGDPQQATGEHITPITPEMKNQPVGGTRYGNMALACAKCNSERGNKDLHEWMLTTKLIKEEEKQLTLDRIESFRKFALYREYSQQETAFIKKRVRALDSFIKGLKTENGKLSSRNYTAEENRLIQDRIKISIHDIQQQLLR